MYEQQLIEIWARQHKFRANLDNERNTVTLYFKTSRGQVLHVKRGSIPVRAEATLPKPSTIAEDPVSLEDLSKQFLQLYGGEMMYYYTSNGQAVQDARVPCISPEPYDYSGQIKHE